MPMRGLAFSRGAAQVASELWDKYPEIRSAYHGHDDPTRALDGFINDVERMLRSPRGRTALWRLLKEDRTWPYESRTPDEAHHAEEREAPRILDDDQER